MDWPSSVAENDAVIVLVLGGSGPQFAVHTNCGAQLLCRTYAEAAAAAVGYARRVHANAWYKGGLNLQLISTFAIGQPAVVPGQEAR